MAWTAQQTVEVLDFETIKAMFEPLGYKVEQAKDIRTLGPEQFCRHQTIIRW